MSGPNDERFAFAAPGLTGGVFARLFRGDRFRFEFGMRRGADSWFHPTPAEHPALGERHRWLEEADDECALWLPEAEPLLAETLSLLGDETSSIPGREELTQLAARWEPDFLLLKRDAGGDFRLVGGAVCFPSSWNPAEKLGRTVEEIHAPVPTVNAVLGPRIRTFLAKLPAGVVFERENWGLAAVPEMNMHPQRNLPRLTTDTSLDRVWLRLEEQAFHALPRSDGVLFLIRLTVHPLREILADAETRAGFARNLATMPDEIAAYKGLATARPSLLAQIAAM